MPSDPTHALSESLIGTGTSREDPRVPVNVAHPFWEDPRTVIYDGSGHRRPVHEGDRSAPDSQSPNTSRPSRCRTTAAPRWVRRTSVRIRPTTRTARSRSASSAHSPENVGLVLTRGMTVVGDELTIRLETATGDGEPVTRTLKWKRVG